MRSLPQSLRRFHLRSLRIALIHRGLLWACLSTGSLALWTSLCVLFRLPREWQLGATMGAISILPAVLFWPFRRRIFLLPLRNADRQSIAESLLEAEGPSRDILARGLRDLEPRLERLHPAFRDATRGLARPAIFAISSLGLLQLIAIALFSQPLLIWDGGIERRESGMRLAESAAIAREAEARRGSPLSSPRMSSREAASIATQKEARQARSASEKESMPGPGLGEKNANPGLPPRDRTSPSQAQSGAKDSEDSRPQSPQGPQEYARPEPGSLGAGAPKPGGQGPEGLTGYEGRGSSGVPSPLIDYKTRLFKELAAREGRDLRASGDLVRTPLPELQRRWFASFEMSADIGPREDAWTSQLRRKWAELLAARGLGK